MPWTSTAIFRWARRVQADGHAATVERLCGELENVNRSTERDFLAVGGHLRDLRANSRELSHLAQSIGERIRGGAGDHLLGSFESLLAAVGAMEKSAGHSEALSQVLAACDQFQHALDRMKQAVMTFHVLGMLTRVETARVDRGSDDWQHLASQVRSMSGEISEQVSRMAAAARSLATLLADGHHRVVQSQHHEIKLLRAVTDRLMKDSAAFRTRRQAADESSVRLAAAYREIASAMEELTTGIQCHDITHQQIEHAIATLRETAGGPADSLPGIAGLESAQLRAARATFLGSVEAIRHSLEKIEDRVREISAESRELLTNTRSEGDSFFGAMEAQAREALGAMAGCRGVEDKIRGVASSARATIGDAARRVKDLESIGVAVERLALNAGIRATHLESAGDPLSVLAAAVKTLAAETAIEGAEMARLLNHMEALVGSFERQVTEESVAQSCVEEFHRAIAEMHEAMDFTSSRLDQIGSKAVLFSTELQETRSAISVDESFRKAMEKIVASLDELHGGAPLPESGAIEQAADRYTMHSERVVHRNFEGTETPAEELVQASTGESFGENVELF